MIFLATNLIMVIDRHEMKASVALSDDGEATRVTTLPTVPRLKPIATYLNLLPVPSRHEADTKCIKDDSKKSGIISKVKLHHMRNMKVLVIYSPYFHFRPASPSQTHTHIILSFTST